MAKAYKVGFLCEDQAWSWSQWSDARGGERLAAGGIGRDADGQPEQTELKRFDRVADAASRVVAALPTQQVLLRVESFPATVEAELASMVELRIDTISPFPVDQIVSDWEILERGDEESLVIIAICKREAVESLVGPVRGPSSRIKRIDVAALVWWHLLLTEGHVTTSGREVVVVCGPDALEIMVHDGGRLLAVASLGTSGADEESLAEDVAWEIQHILRSLDLEVGPAETAIAVWGGSESLPASVGMRTGLVTRPQSLSMLGCSLADGVAMRDSLSVGALDLVPEPWRVAERARCFRKRLITGSLLVVGLWVVFVGGMIGWRFFRQYQVRQIAAEHARWAGPANEVLQMRKRLGMIRRYMDRSDSALECLREVVAAMPPDGLDLISFIYKKDDVIILEGLSNNGQLRLVFLEALKRSALFPRVESGTTSLVKGRFRFKFELYFKTEASE